MLKLTVFVLSLVASLGEVSAKRPIFNKHGKRQGAVLAGSYINNITVAADDVVQCNWATISWTGAIAPYKLMIGFGGQYVGTTEISTFPDLYDNTFSWQVAEPSTSQSLIFQITDSTGAVGYVQNVRIEASDDYSCLTTGSGTSTVQSSASSSAAGYTKTMSSSSSMWSAETTSASAAGTTTRLANSIGSGSGGTAQQVPSGTTSAAPVASTTSTSSSTSHTSSSSSVSSGTVGLAAASSVRTSSARRSASLYGSIALGAILIPVSLVYA